MPTILSDPAPGLYLVLIALVVITGAIAARNQDRRSLVRFAIASAILLGLYAIDRAVESPREEAVRRTLAIVQAVDERNPTAFAEHLADQVVFNGESPGSAQTRTREELRNHRFWEILRQHQVHVAAWDFSRDDVQEIDADTIEIGFLAKAEAEGKTIPMYLRATFARKSDGRLLLTRVAAFDPVQRTNKPASFPFP